MFKDQLGKYIGPDLGQTLLAYRPTDRNEALEKLLLVVSWLIASQISLDDDHVTTLIKSFAPFRDYDK